MKGLSIKRIAAIGLGAALVGSALAPVVSAANVVPTGLDNLVKSSVIDSTGAPAVDVVVGANAAVSDVVWAGNIAARVAQLATVSSGASGAASVDVTVGGSTTTTGAGDTVESVVSFGSAETDFQSIQVTDSKMPSLVNNTSADLTWAGTDYTTSVKEVLKGTIDAEFEGSTSSTKYVPGELYGSIEAGDVNYSVELGMPLDISANLTNLDSNSDYDVKLPWLGKTYVLDEVKAGSSPSLVLYADTTPTDLEVGQKISVESASGYAGKTLEIQLVDLIQIGSGNQTYEPKWALLIDGVVTKYVQKKADVTYNLRDEFGKTYFTDNIYVTSAGLNLAANKYTATIRTGSERIELKDGKGYPFTDDSTVDNKAQWKVVFDSTTSLTKISLVNQWSYKKTSGSETDTSKYVLKVGEEVTLPEDFATFKFVGLQSKPSAEVLVGEVDGIEGGGVQYVDLRGNTVMVPMYTQFDLDFNNPTEIQVAGKDFTLWLDEASNVADFDLFYTEGKHGDAEVHTSWSTIADLNYNDVAALPLMLDLGAETKNGTTVDTNYYFVADESDALAALTLAPQVFNIANKADSSSVPQLEFTDGNNGGLAYYAPNTEDFLEVLSGLGTYSSDVHMAALFTYTDNESYTVDLALDSADSAKVWDYVGIKGSDKTLFGPTADATASDWKLGEDVDNPLSSALTEDGTMVESDASVFTLTVPEETRNAEVYLGSTDTTTSVVGGTSFTGLANGASETKGNVSVKVDAISGASGAGVTVVPVGNLVKTSSSMGKSIIVGGWLANAAAKNLQVSDGQDLESLLVNSGDYVAAVTPSGSIVVAGITAADTGAAASELINALEGLM